MGLTDDGRGVTGGSTDTSLKGSNSGQQSFTCTSQKRPGGHCPRLVQRKLEVNPAAQLAVNGPYTRRLVKKKHVSQTQTYNHHR